MAIRHLRIPVLSNRCTLWEAQFCNKLESKHNEKQGHDLGLILLTIPETSQTHFHILLRVLVCCRFLKGRVNDGFQIDMEDFIRNTIRSFPFRESNLFKHIVKTLARVEKVNCFRSFNCFYLWLCFIGLTPSFYSKQTIQLQPGCFLIFGQIQPEMFLYWFLNLNTRFFL